MSIYPVRLSEWYPIEDEKFEIILSIIKVVKCYSCHRKVRYKAAIGHHSLPWGHGELWCSWKCCDSGIVRKLGKKRNRRLKRELGRLEKEEQWIILSKP